MHIAAAIQITKHLIPSLKTLIGGMKKKEEGANFLLYFFSFSPCFPLIAYFVEFSHIVKIGRTHLQDAVPITLGQEFSAYVQQLEFNMDGIEGSIPRLFLLAQGGTAVGTVCPSISVKFHLLGAQHLRWFRGKGRS